MNIPDLECYLAYMDFWGEIIKWKDAPSGIEAMAQADIAERPLRLMWNMLTKDQQEKLIAYSLKAKDSA